RAALFLTATPMQLDSGELYSLIEMLDPALFPTAQRFDWHRSQVSGLSQLVHELSEHGFPPPYQDEQEVVERVARWLETNIPTARRRLSAGRESVAGVC